MSNGSVGTCDGNALRLAPVGAMVWSIPVIAMASVGTRDGSSLRLAPGGAMVWPIPVIVSADVSTAFGSGVAAGASPAASTLAAPAPRLSTRFASSLISVSPRRA